MKIRFFPVWLVVGALLAISRLAAQDVTVTDPAWMDRENPPSVPPPHYKSAPKPDYPDEMRKADVVGYAIVPLNAGINGESLRLATKATNPYFEKAMDFERSKLLPALKDGKPVEGLWWYAAIFNPASSSAKGANAAPRLTHVEPVFVSKKLLPKGTKLPLIVWGTASVDEKGASQKVVLDDPAFEPFREAIEKGIERWRFSPARKDKQPVAGELHVPFFIVPPYQAPKEPQNLVPPKAVYKERPVYPRAMKMSGLRGEVTLSFVVTKEGTISNPVIVKSNNPGFNEEALEALKKWKFEPGQRDGHPADAKMQLSMQFDITGDGGGRDFATVGQMSKKEQEKIPEQFRYDVAPKPQGIITPVYPYPQLRDKKDGKVLVAFLVSEEGKISETKVLEATTPEMGQAMVAALDAFSFMPALKDGKPTRTVIKIEQKFEAGTFGPLITDQDLAMLSLERKHPDRIFPVEKLDGPLNRTSHPAPVFPVALRGKLDRGEAKVEFLVDDEGKVHLPRIVEATDPAFGYAAVQALASWRFDPPKAAGKTVVARTQQLIRFGPKQVTPKPEPAPTPPAESKNDVGAEAKTP